MGVDKVHGKQDLFMKGEVSVDIVPRHSGFDPPGHGLITPLS